MIRSKVKPATLLIRTDLFLILLVEEFYGARYPSGSFSLIYVKSGFYCLRYFLFICTCHHMS